MKLVLVDDEGLHEVVIEDIEAAMKNIEGYESVYSLANFGVAIRHKLQKIKEQTRPVT